MRRASKVDAGTFIDQMGRVRPRIDGKHNPNYKGGGGYKIECAQCSETFRTSTKGRKYCSLSCAAKSNENLKIAAERGIVGGRPKTILGPYSRLWEYVCRGCGVHFVRKKSNSKSSARCEKCKKTDRLASLRSRRRRCKICGKLFLSASASQVKVNCSPRCSSEYKSIRQRGKKSHLWQGGKTTEAMRIRNSREYADWRAAVFQRDGYVCQECGKRGGRLNADHIKPFSTHPELRLCVDNGRTLCEPCHRKTPTWGRKAVDQP